MKSTLTKIVIFAAGAAIGSAVTWKIMYDHQEQLIQEEVEEFKKYTIDRVGKMLTDGVVVPNEDSEEEVANDTPEAPVASIDKKAYAQTVKRMNYRAYSKADNSEEDDEDEMDDGDCPYVISPEEFGEMSDYETISLTYYADKVLTDEYDNVIEDVGETVGWESLDHFGEYEDDSVFVRNDKRKCDYEILLDERKFSDVVGRSPHSAED